MTYARKKSIITTICVGLAFIAFGLVIMFAVLRPQDKYEKVIATVKKAYYMGGTRCPVIVEYTVDGQIYNKEFDDWIEHYDMEKLLVRYKVGNPNKIRPRFYTFFMSLAIEAMAIGAISILSLLVTKEKLRYKSKAEFEKENKIYLAFVISAIVITLLIPICGALSPLIYNSKKIFKVAVSVIPLLQYI